MATRQVIGTGLLVAVLAGLLATAAQAGQGNPRVAARDQLNITVWGVTALTKKYPVGADGMVEFPQLGRLEVAGMTAREISELLVTKLKERELLLDPQVTVEVEQFPNKKVTINGSVRTPGAVAFAGELSLLEALTRAGGRLPEAADTVLVVRAAAMQDPAGTADTPLEASMVEVNVRELENGELTHNLVLHDGDNVFVRKMQAVTITGYVRNVGPYNVEPGTNVEQALALAGGITERGSDRRIEITRKENGKTITLKGVKKTDLVKPGDIIKVGPRIM